MSNIWKIKSLLDSERNNLRNDINEKRMIILLTFMWRSLYARHWSKSFTYSNSVIFTTLEKSPHFAKEETQTRKV